MNKIYKGIEHTALLNGLARKEIVNNVVTNTDRVYSCQLTNNDTGETYSSVNVSWTTDNLAKFTFPASQTKTYNEGCVSLAVYDSTRAVIYYVKHYAKVYDVNVPAASTTTTTTSE